jgi:dTDP-4-dehydrorhamnose 3,5-epimerase
MKVAATELPVVALVSVEDDCEMFYMMGQIFVAELASGWRWNDPAFAIECAFPPAVISERDAGWPDFAR